MSQADNFVKNWRKMPDRNPKLDLFNFKAHAEFGENPLRFTHVIVLKRKYGRNDVQQTGRQTDMDDQHETIIPRHYHVTGYKNGPT